MPITSNIIPLWPWFQPPPGGRSDPAPILPGDQRTIPGLRFGCFLGHEHWYRPQPNPGADAFAYTALGLSEFSPIGAGTINRDQLDHYQPVPLFAGQAVPPQGLGGLVQGQFVTAPLIVPISLQTDVGGDETPFGTG